MITDNLQTIHQKIKTAAELSGRSAQDILLVAVSKKKSVDEISEAVAAGQTVFGENYIQEAVEKISAVNDFVSWHFIGHLQSNKARIAVQHFDVIQTVDKLKTARLLDKYADEFNKEIDIFVQINISREQQKAGIMEEDALPLLKDLRQFSRLKVRGLMTMPPYAVNPEANRPYFRALKKISLSLMHQELFADDRPPELSMGMSNDYTVAIEEGATVIRVGTAIFGQRG